MKEPLKNTGKQITKIKKYKNHVTLYFKEEKLEVSYDVFTSFYLYEGKTVSDKEYKQLTGKVDIEKYLSYALRLLSNKMYSEWKMREKLYAKEAEKAQVDEVINYLKKNGFIDDQLYIEEYLEYASRNKIGKNKIKTNLLNKGIFQEDIDKIRFKESDEIKKANSLVPKLIKKYERYNATSQKDHIVQALIREGYDLSTALEVTRSLSLLDNKKEQELLKKDYDLVYQKYRKKYEGRELKEKVIASLLRKGYKRKDIFMMMDNEYEIC